ncbi:MAG: hypothetical protein QM581_04970 [Pseudomonas sp.]
MSGNEHEDREEWIALGTHWRAQPLPEWWDALGAEVRCRSLRLRWLRRFDWLMAAVAVGMCAWATQLPPPRNMPVGVAIGLAALVLGYTAWAQWQRRRQWRAYAATPAALLEFERGRTLTSLRLWRVSTWLSCAMWVGLVVLAMLAWHAEDAPGRLPASAWLTNVVANGGVLLAAALLAWAAGARARRRLRRLERLSCSLAADEASA